MFPPFSFSFSIQSQVLILQLFVYGLIQVYIIQKTILKNITTLLFKTPTLYSISNRNVITFYLHKKSFILVLYFILKDISDLLLLIFYKHSSFIFLHERFRHQSRQSTGHHLRTCQVRRNICQVRLFVIQYPHNSIYH